MLDSNAWSMYTSSRCWLRASIAVLLLAIPGACDLRSDADEPNIVFISIDTLRADRLGAYGYFRDTTPVLDALAKESLVFERCLAPMATTFPSHLSLLTGTYPLETGALANVGAGGRAFQPTPNLRSLAQVLQESGYRTAAFVSSSPLTQYSGIHAGFGVFDEPNAKTRRADVTSAAALEWLDGQVDEPYFLWVHYYDPHRPYRSPAPFATRYHPEPDLDRYLTERDFQAVYEDGSIQSLSNHYDGEVSYVDQQIGHLIENLRSRPSIWDRTVVVVIGDHGEGLGQHARPEHGGVWDEQLHVPLMMRIPGVPPARIERLMSVADVVPTVMALVRLPGEEDFLRQASGVDRLTDESDETLIFGQESAVQWRARPGSSGPRYTLTGDQWKFIHDPDGEDLLFRLPNDPFELKDVRDRFPDVAERMGKVVLARVERQKKRRAYFESNLPSSGDDVDPAIIEQLRSLGYVR